MTRKLSILIVDFDDERGSHVERLVRGHAGAAAVIRSRSYSAAPTIDSPRLAFWHVSPDQNAHEGGSSLGPQVKTFVEPPESWVAGFTGGTLPPQLRAALPEPGDRFRVTFTAARGIVPDSFGAAIARTVTAWITAEGRFARGGLATAWLGMDPLLESKLDFLAARLEGRAPLEKSLQTLRAHYPASVLDEESVPPGPSDALKSLRDLFFGL